MSNRLGGKQGTAYLGTNANQPPNWHFENRPPTQYDFNNVSEGDFWLDQSAAGIDRVWVLVSLQGNSMSKGALAQWEKLGVGDLETLTGNSGGPVSPDAMQNINVVGDGTTVDIVGNPATNTLTVSAVGTGVLSTLTGDSGGPVSPLAGNINILDTANNITITGNPGTHTLTANTGGHVATSYITSPATGTAVPAAGVLTFAGTGGISVSAGGSTVTITNSGTPAPQCAFGAYKSTDSPNVTGDGTFFTVVCDGEIYDLDSNYNPGTGVFTAPSDGTYHFDMYVGTYNISDQNLSGITIVTTQATFHSDLQSPVNDKSADNILHYQLSVDAQMSMGDTCFIQVSLGGGSGAKTVGVIGAIPPGSPIATYFNGHRIDPAASFITGAESFVTDSGTATPNITGVVNINGSSGITTSAPGSGNTIVINSPASNTAFSVTLNAETNLSGDGTVAQVGTAVAGTISYDLGGNVSAGGGGNPIKFTAPVTGYYQFNLEIGISITAVTGGNVFGGQIVSSSGFNTAWGNYPSLNQCTGFFGVSGTITVDASALVKMSATDTVTISFTSVGGAKVDGIAGGVLTGYRVA